MADSITDLLAYRLHRVANHISKSAALRYRAAFAVSLGEWRTLALLGARAPLSVLELARAAGLDRGQMSRVATTLEARGLVRRRPHDTDGRGVLLVLTSAGRRRYHGLIATARQRDVELLGCLTALERRALNTILGKLDDQARTLVHRERSRRPAVTKRRSRGATA